MTRSEKSKGGRRWLEEHALFNTIMCAMFLFILIAAVGFFSTKDKAPKETSTIPKQDNRAVNADSADSTKNVLTLGQIEDVNLAVKEYYAELANHSDFVESYDNVQVYTKTGPYEDSYIVFAYYEMKIRDIYTKVPGLGTLYVEKDADGVYQLNKEVSDQNVSGLLRKLMLHEDVQALMADVQSKYTAAVHSDELLKEAMDDLQQVYEDSAAGTVPAE